MKSIIIISAVSLVLVAIACDSPKREEDSVKMAGKRNREAFDNTQKEGDAEFIVDAVAACYSEIALAELGLLHSGDSVLQRKLRVIESDHTRILIELRAYASRQLITVPAEETNYSKTQIRLVADSNSEDFDIKLCTTLRDHHQDEMRKFETCMSRTADMELKNWIALTLPVLNDHLKMIKDHQAVLNSK